jgi:hypothetical protein
MESNPGNGRGSRSAFRDEDATALRDQEPTVVDRRASVVGSTTSVREQQQRFGGLSFASAFFGWLSATGIAALLLALLGAGGAVFALTDAHPVSSGKQNAETISLAAGVGLVVVLAIAYFAGGYVAGRMARFDGIRQGVGVWTIGVVVTGALAIAGAIFGSEYNVLANLNMPNIPIDNGSLTAGGIVALIAAVLATLGAAILGGKAGEAYHRRIDDAGRI